MAQATNPSIATGQTGTAYRTQDNDRYAAALTHHSGSTRPSYAVAGTLWLDTSGTPWILKMYDGADDISVGTVNASTNAFNASNAASTSSTIAMTAAINEAGATVASASTTDIGAAAGNYVSVTGTTTITALGTVQTGTRRTVRFAGILTLTHNGTSLILPGAANITTAAGDVATFISLGSGNWFCASYIRASQFLDIGSTVQAYDSDLSAIAAQSFSRGDILYHDGTSLTRLGAGTSGQYLKTNGAAANPEWASAAGKIAQIVTFKTSTYATGTTSIPDDNTIPQSSEGDQFMSLSITPTNSSSTLMIDVIAFAGHSAQHRLTTALFKDSGSGAIAAVSAQVPDPSAPIPLVLRHSMTAGGTSLTTFKVRIGSAGSGTTYFCGSYAAQLFGGVAAASVTIVEILP